DMRGIPVDFRYTDPVRPTRLERILYGSSLDTYLKEELMLESLLDSIEVNPQIWLCNDADILDPLREKSRAKTVLAEESSHVPLDAAGHIETTADPGVFLIQATPNGAPLRAEFPAGIRPDEIQQTAEILTESAATMDILEPFARLGKALSFLATSSR
ncbi:MAG: hypothetical protein II877_10015, partial [Synergistaceae bacterium]|nr:hypothetical protein [Synergistaceae bacterium]